MNGQSVDVMGAFTKLEQVVSLTIAPALNFSLFTLGDIKKVTTKFMKSFASKSFPHIHFIVASLHQNHST